jgi:glycine/D-amino acid oxidase-like deaminating enzyme
MVVAKTDIAIIGGGVQGLFLAYYAKIKFPAKKVSLFEAGAVGSGITAYSGHLHTHTGAGDKYYLVETSLKLYKELLAVYPDFPIEQREFLGICHRDNLDATLSQLTRKPLFGSKAEYPFLNLGSDYHILSGLNAYVTKRSLVNFMLEIVAAIGVKIHEGNCIQNLAWHSGRYHFTNQYDIEHSASVVLNATGKSIFSWLGESAIKLRSKKVVAFHIDRLGNPDNSIYYFFDDDAFLLPQPYYNRFLFSYRCEDWDVDVSLDRHQINDSDLKAARKVLNKYSIGLSDHIMGGQVSVDVYNTPESSPLIHQVGNNYFVIGATGGSGVRLAPALATMTLDRITI